MDFRREIMVIQFKMQEYYLVKPFSHKNKYCENSKRLAQLTKESYCNKSIHLRYNPVWHLLQILLPEWAILLCAALVIIYLPWKE